MIKIILLGILLISTMAFNVSANVCDHYETFTVGEGVCMGGIYIRIESTGTYCADVHICERGVHTECIRSSNVFVDGIVHVHDEWIIDDLEFINYDSSVFINVSWIDGDEVELRICDSGSGDPIPTPTPDPTPTPTATPGDGGDDDTYNTSEDYSGSLDGTGVGGGRGGIYDSIGRGLGDGGSGNAVVSRSLFYAMIPVLFVIVTIIFIGKLLGIDIGKLKR